MRTSIKILEEERHLSGEEADILKRALQESTSGITTIRELMAAVQQEGQMHREAESLARTGNPGQAVHRYEGSMLKTRGTIHHLITALEGELTTLEHLVRDLHRIDERISERMRTLRSAVEERRAA
jgi:hypothetical protein